MNFFAAPYHPLRPFLLSRAAYLLLAGDLWLGMVQHGGRYGLGDFNVAHFALLDVLLPVHSPGPYVALLVFSGFISLSLGLFGQPRWLRALLAVTYSLAWMISIHDSYQHHYFISWLLAWLAAFPEPAARDLTASERVRGWGLPMTCLTCAIVYAFTGVAKSEAAWRRGDVLRALTRGESATNWGEFTPLLDFLRTHGVSEDVLYAGFAYATIALQWTIAIGYVFAPRRDSAPATWRTILVTLGLLGALSFHASAELYGHFEIGVFSYYMLVLALTLLSPISLLLPVGRAITQVRAAIEPWIRKISGSESWPRLFILLSLVALIGLSSPLPGTFSATIAAAVTVGARLWLAARSDDRLLRPIAVQTALCGLSLWLALSQSSVSFDYFRRVAGEQRKMGQRERALESYRAAERYAPEGASRAREIRELERELHRQ
jgi:hypothetical protein